MARTCRTVSGPCSHRIARISRSVGPVVRMIAAVFIPLRIPRWVCGMDRGIGAEGERNNEIFPHIIVRSTAVEYVHRCQVVQHSIMDKRPSMPSAPHILIAEDHADVRDLLTTIV